MVTIRGLDHVVIRARNLESMLAFYRDVLGCPVEREELGQGLVQLRAGCSLIDLVPVDGPLGRAGGAPPGSEGHNVDHFCLKVEPFDEALLFEHLQRCGVQVEEAARRYGAEGFGPSVYIRDPEGNRVELKGPPDGS